MREATVAATHFRSAENVDGFQVKILVGANQSSKKQRKTGSNLKKNFRLDGIRILLRISYKIDQSVLCYKRSKTIFYIKKTAASPVPTVMCSYRQLKGRVSGDKCDKSVNKR